MEWLRRDFVRTRRATADRQDATTKKSPQACSVCSGEKGTKAGRYSTGRRPSLVTTHQSPATTASLGVLVFSLSTVPPFSRNPHCACDCRFCSSFIGKRNGKAGQVPVTHARKDETAVFVSVRGLVKWVIFRQICLFDGIRNCSLYSLYSLLHEY
jgi:hypothetical protein